MHDQSIQVLVVDDSDADRALFRFFLEQPTRQQYSIREAGDGAECFRACEDSLPDCVLLDYGLPDADGLEVLARLRERFGAHAFAVVFLTGSGDELLAACALQSGAQEYVPKGLLSSNLLARAIESAIEKIDLLREREHSRRALEESEKKLRAIMTTVPAVVYIFDLQARIPTFISDYSAVITGYTSVELMAMGQAFTQQMVHPEDIEDVHKHFEHLMRANDGQEFVCEYRMRQRTGGWRSMLSRDRVFERSAAGSVRRIIGAATDVTERRAIEAALRTDQLRIQIAEEAGGIGIWDWNIAENISYCSPSYFALYGLKEGTKNPTHEEWLANVHPDDRQSALADVKTALAGGPYDSEFRVIWLDGSVHWLSGRATLLYENGVAVRMVGANVDITKRKTDQEELRQAHEKLRALMEIAPVGIFTALDAEASRIVGNQMAYDLVELPIGVNLSKSASPDDRPTNFRVVKTGKEIEPENLPIQTVARTGKPLLGHECDLLFQDGRSRCILGNTLPLLDAAGKPAGAISAYLDVTERKRMERELRRSNEDLEHFASMASHDLQEPLRSITGFADLIRRRAGLPDELEEYLQFISSGANRMQALIADLLAYARIANEPRHLLAAVPLEGVVAEALRSLQQAVRESEAEVIVQRLPIVLGNQRLLLQLFQNLLANALKYRSSRRPCIRIDSEPVGSAWLVRVQDNGIGIDMQYADMIFEPFKRLHSREEYSGTGVGLAICKRVVEQHGGRIWVESRVDKGTTFLFTLREAAHGATNSTSNGFSANA